MDSSKAVTSSMVSNSWHELLEFLRQFLEDVKRSKTIVATVAVTASIFALYKFGKRNDRKNESYPDLPDWNWFRGHLSLVEQSNSMGRVLQGLACKTNEGAGYFRMFWGEKYLGIFKAPELKELFQTYGSKSSGRAANIRLHLEYRSHKGILESEGPLWKENRKIFHSYMRTWGKENQLKLIIEESKFLVAALENIDHDFYPEELLQMAVSNIISTFIFGSRFEYDDPDSHKIFESITRFNERNEFLPYSLWLFFTYVPIRKSFNRRVEGIRQTKNFIKQKIEERMRSGIVNPPETMIDAYALETQSNADKLDVENLENVIYELFFAGTETTSTTLCWFLACISKHPEVQDRMFAEIEENIGKSDVSFDDFKRLPYTIAVQHEVQRFGAIAHNTLLHRMTEDVRTSTKLVKKGEQVFGGLYVIMRDPTYFKYPEAFNPENFLDESGQYQPNEAFVPYGLGPRVCLGQVLADLELKIFMIELVRKFKISSSENIDLNERIQKLTSVPVSHRYLFTKR